MTFDPSAQHPDYVEYLPVWRKCRDAAAGERKIKAGGTLYLPSPSGYNQAVVLESGRTAAATYYDAYLARAYYFNATGRSLEGYVGMVMRKSAKVVVPTPAEPWLDDITLTDETMDDFAGDCLREALLARGGILVDMSELESALTQAQADAQQLRPYLSLYKAESIINWERARINGAYRLKNLFLQENYVDDLDNKVKVQIRQLSLDTGAYTQIVWHKNEAGWFVFKAVTPIRDGKPFAEIPFFPISADKPTIEISPPPIEDLADMNIAHYRDSANYQNILFMSCVSTFVISGHQRQEGAGPILLGTNTALVLDEPEAKAYFAQAGSEGTAPTQQAMQDKVQHMAALGARMIAPEKKQAETAEAQGIRRGGENSVLAALAGVVSRQLQKALAFAVDWQGLDSSGVEVELNKDLVPWNVTFDDLSKAWSLVQQGAYSKDVFGNLLGYADLVPEDFDYKADQTKASVAGPTVVAE